MNWNILIAEDDPSIRCLLTLLLEDEGYAPSAVGNGLDAVEHCRRQPVDLVVMDLRMPVMDGIEATRLIKGLPGPSGRTRILGITAFGSLSERDSYLRQGLDEFLVKPFDDRRFLEAVRGMLKEA